MGAAMAEGSVAPPEDGAEGKCGEASDAWGGSEVTVTRVGVIYTVLAMWLI